MIYLAAVLSGVLSALSLPSSFAGWRFPESGWLAWVALTPLLLALRKTKSSKQAMRLGWAYGLTHFLITLYWVIISLHQYGEVALWISILALLLLAVLMAAFPAVVCWISFPLARRFSWALVFPLAWTVGEFLRNYIPCGGFPWAGLAYSQHSFLTLLQILDVTGVYGLVFLIVMGNGVLAGWVDGVREAGDRAIIKIAPTCGVILLLVGALIYGHFRLAAVRRSIAGAPTLQVAVVQGNIPQEEKWLEEKIEEIIARHVTWTRKAEEASPDLVFWPEAAFPAVLPPELTRIAELKGLNTDLLMGVVRYDGVMPETWPAEDPSAFRLYNSAVLLKPQGEIEDRYDKVHLVPVGEYVPLAGWLPFFHEIVDAMGTFTSGDGFHLLTLENNKFGVTICYEDLFPEISRAFARGGADFLVNLTNDGWYNRSSVIFQHFDFSRYRAIETRLSMIRSTNTGVTGLFAPTGEVLASLPPFEEGVLHGAIPLKPAGRWSPSFYTRFGDVFAWGCVLALVLLTLNEFRVYQRENSVRNSPKK